MPKPRLFIGGYRELRRPVNVVDESLMARIEAARRRLQLEGKDIKPVRFVRQRSRPLAAPDRDRRVIALRTHTANADAKAQARSSA